MKYLILQKSDSGDGVRTKCKGYVTSERNAANICDFYNNSLLYKEFYYKRVADSFVALYECLDDIIKTDTENTKNEEKYVNFRNFEINLRFLLNELNDDATDEDQYMLDDIKHSIMIFAMKEKFNETDETFLENTKREFYDSIVKLESRHPDLKYRTKLIKLFMEQYYFNT